MPPGALRGEANARLAVLRPASDRRGDGGENLADIGAEQAHAADDDHRHEGSDQGIFERRHAVLVTAKPMPKSAPISLAVISFYENYYKFFSYFLRKASRFDGEWVNAD